MSALTGLQYNNDYKTKIYIFAFVELIAVNCGLILTISIL